MRSFRMDNEGNVNYKRNRRIGLKIGIGVAAVALIYYQGQKFIPQIRIKF